jgi:hypothetical protein
MLRAILIALLAAAATAAAARAVLGATTIADVLERENREAGAQMYCI